jgi:cell division protein FtsX
MIDSGPQKDRSLWGVLVGAAVGLAVSSVIYRLLVPVLEDSSGWVRELQGPLLNLVLLLTGVGALLGWLVVRAHSHRDGKGDS